MSFSPTKRTDHEKIQTKKNKCGENVVLSAFRLKVRDILVLQQHNNIKGSVENTLSESFQQHLVCELIKKNVNSNCNGEPECPNTFSLSQIRGKPLCVAVRPENKKEIKQISAAAVSNQTNCGISTNKVLEVSKAFRIAAEDRNLFEPNLKRKLSKINHKLDSFFHVENENFIKTVKDVSNAETKELVICKNFENFLNYVLELRSHIKLGLDGGGGFLKLCVSLNLINNETVDESYYEGTKAKSRRQNFKDGIVAKKFKETGVKKLFILGIVSDTQENYANSNTLCNKINFSCNKFREWEASGRDKKNSKEFKCCVNMPIIKENPDTLIIDVFPPPELHLVLGVVNTIFEKMEALYINDALKWAVECGLSRVITNGGRKWMR
ncbi:unnamed protein product [Brassicogethes aeneus]|uniref:Uncharacterized protein n=1 Tax=Brassicogethes aeneus TaxID=1431903 RepID=A0A9P0BEU2_BRAAE|nr:unnamed protein product [Brassicogethes aeneus]